MPATSTEVRHVLITGGLGDIGLATAVRLSRDGLTVHVSDLLDPDTAHQRLLDVATTADLTEPPRYIRADVRNRDDVHRAVAAPPRLDIVIANAGTVRSAPFLDITDEQWQTHIDINLAGSFIVAQEAARRMVADGTGGLVLFTGSWVGQIPWPEISAYTVTKAGIEMLARQIARELAGHGIRANVVAPGIVRAGLAKIQLETEPQYAARAARAVPLGQLQTAEEVAAAFSFLCSPDSTYMTGATLLVDGGASLHALD